MMDYDLSLLNSQHVEPFQSLQAMRIPSTALDRVYQLYVLLNQVPEEEWSSDQTAVLISQEIV